MQFSLEKLSSEDFQRLIQAILAATEPSTQSMPVGMADGGRDALVHRAGARFDVYQVKHTQQPGAVRNPVTWLAQAIEEERPKIERLAERGAERYIIATNVVGGAKLDRGAVDRINQMLRGLPIPSQVWWQADICSRLDSLPQLWWSFPTMLDATAILSQVARQQSQAQADALTHYIRRQYTDEHEIRFRQIDLTNDLFALFVDLPLHPSDDRNGAFTQAVMEVSRRQPATSQLGWHLGRPNVGAAAFLLDAAGSERVPRLVLRGGPGQGKSTITQFLCQVHRARLLGIEEDLEHLDAEWIAAPVRLPIKVELRDLAQWLGGEDPYTKEPLPSQAVRSLEGLIARQIELASGGVSFQIGDLADALRDLHVLLVLDGLDEVAETAVRRATVQELERSCDRLGQVATSLQVIVTTRPPAYAESPTLHSRKFHTADLAPLGPALIQLYASRWAEAKGLQGNERQQLLALVDRKVSEPHVRDLARNPMQLAILLTLIHTRGASLPARRTQLYDEYVSIFLSREAEKDTTVRDNRDLLIQIHRYLGWRLQVEAESGRGNGRIARESIVRLLEDYLEAEGRDTSLAAVLFTAAAERVVAIVSRYEGTFEFEVQPLREYFCARHLYSTAPYSPPGKPVNGTRPDRFRALARNPYWLNVARFYAGCFDKGELPALVYVLLELAEDRDVGVTVHVRVLAQLLLSDHVLAQDLRVQSSLLDLAFDDLGLGAAIAGQLNGEPAGLSPDCGGYTLGTLALSSAAVNVGNKGIAIQLANLATSGVNPQLDAQWLHALSEIPPDHRSTWLHCGSILSTYERLQADDFAASVESAVDWQAVFGIRPGRIVAKIPDGEVHFIRLVVAGGAEWYLEPDEVDAYCALARVVGFLGTPMSMQSFFPETYIDWGLPPERLADYAGSIANVPIRRFLSRAAEALRLGRQAWGISLTPWEDVVESGRSLLGEGFAWTSIANMSAHVKNPRERGSGFSDLFDAATSLVRRVRHARVRGASVDWWSAQWRCAESSVDRMLGILVLTTWSDKSRLHEHRESLCPQLDALSGEDFRSLTEGMRWHRRAAPRRRGRLDFDNFSGRLSPRLLRVLFEISDERERAELAGKHLDNYKGKNHDLLAMRAEVIAHRVASGKGDWEDLRKASLRALRAGFDPSFMLSQPISRHVRRDEMPLVVARRVMGKPLDHALPLVRAARDVARGALSADHEAVWNVAQREGWLGA